MYRLSTATLKLLGKIALLAYFVVAVLLLATRYAILPNLDHWRADIGRKLSSVLHVGVHIGEVSAQWRGPNPRVALHELTLTDSTGRQVLKIPSLTAEVSWRSLFSRTPQFVLLKAQGVDLAVRRDTDGRLWFAGQAGPRDTADGADARLPAEFMDWLAGQQNIVVQGANIRWRDEGRTGEQLVLQDVNLSIANQGVEHRFSLRATPPTDMGSSLDIRGQYHYGGKTRAHNESPGLGDGQFYGHVEDMRPLKWRPWLDVPEALRSGRGSARAWVSTRADAVEHMTAELVADDLLLSLTEQTQVQAKSFHLYLAGPWDAVADFRLPARQEDRAKDRDPDAGRRSEGALSYQVSAQGVDVYTTELFEYPLDFDHLNASGSLHNATDGLRVGVDWLHVSNEDMLARMQGRWQQGGSGELGLIDAQGVFQRAAITAIDEYLPNFVSEEVRDWLASGLLEGQIEDATVLLRGDLEHFPFQKDVTQGEFEVSGRYAGGVIDYLPATKEELGWPRLNEMRGHVRLHRAELSLTAEQSTMLPAEGLPIHLRELSAHISDMEQDSVLRIQGQTEASAQTYLALMKNSPLGGFLDGMFEQALAEGSWEVPLSLTIPLTQPDNTRVEGAVKFAGGSLRFEPQLPVFRDLKGSLTFTNDVVSSSELHAELLGGPVRLSGEIGKETEGIRMTGKATVAALADFVDVEGMSRLKGVVPYQARVRRTPKGAVVLNAESDLKGLGADLPEPLAKAADETLPLNVEWGIGERAGNRQLVVRLGNEVQVLLLHDTRKESKPLFYAGTVGVNQEPELLARGLNVDIQHRSIDVDAWDTVLTEFSRPRKGAGERAATSVFPPIEQFRLQAVQAVVKGVALDELTFTARQPEPQRWRVDISSSQTAGTMFWREAKGRIAGQIDADFDRLALGPDNPPAQASAVKQEENLEVHDELDIPAVSLHVKKLRLYGRDVGELSVVGVNQERGRLWRLDELKLSSPHAVLSGSGMWRLTGPRRGLTLTADAQVNDLGGYLDQIGFKDVMSQGQGELTAELEWFNMPWAFSKVDLNGNLGFHLEKGRFSTVNSHSARLLELLSLQSIKRLAKLDSNPASLGKGGFPYDTLRGNVLLKNGVMNTDDYRVIGPAGTIVIGGDVDLVDERLDLQAVVIPNLDVSGAAVAAGIAINPIVGIGAFLTQWLLQGPLAKAMTVEYTIGGDWNDPKIAERRMSGAREGQPTKN